MAATLRFYLDENVPVEVAKQLRARGIDVVTVRDLGLLGATDAVHIARAAAEECVLCTYDADYLQMASEGVEHCGIVFGQQDVHYIGEWVRFLTLLHAVYAPEEMNSRVEFL